MNKEVDTSDIERQQSTTVTERNEIDAGPPVLPPPARTTEQTASVDFDEDPFVKNIVDIYSTKKHSKHPPKAEHRHHKHAAPSKKPKPKKDVRKISKF